jgi:hypothetical protein
MMTGISSAFAYGEGTPSPVGYNSSGQQYINGLRVQAQALGALVEVTPFDPNMNQNWKVISTFDDAFPNYVQPSFPLKTCSMDPRESSGF